MSVTEKCKFVVFDSKNDKTEIVEGVLITFTPSAGIKTYICNCTYKGMLLTKNVSSKSLIDKPFHYPPQ
jgi:hypothetical protein